MTTNVMVVTAGQAKYCRLWKAWQGGGDRTKGDVRGTEGIDSFKREKHQNRRIRSSKVHAIYPAHRIESELMRCQWMNDPERESNCGWP